MNKFLIKKSEYFDEYGKLAHEFYYIQERKKFLWWEYLKTIKHEECYGGGCSKSKTTFRTLEEAKDFIKEVLVPSKPRNTHTSKPIVETTWRGGREVDMSRVTFPTKEKQSANVEREGHLTLPWDSLPTPNELNKRMKKRNENNK